MASSLPSLHVTGVAVGGDGLARDEFGRVVLVAGALPGEEVRAEVVDARKGHARAVVAEVLSAAPARVVPPCPRAVEGCGGAAPAGGGAGGRSGTPALVASPDGQGGDPPGGAVLAGGGFPPGAGGT